MRNKYELQLREMENQVYHVRIIRVNPYGDNEIEMEMEFLDGPLSREFHSIYIPTGENDE